MRHAGGIALLVLFFTYPSSADARPRTPAKRAAYTATAYCKKGETASGEQTRRGIAAADPRYIPLGSTVRISGVGVRRGNYVVQDAGVKGKRIDIFMPSCRDAKRFGKKRVQLQIIERAEPAAEHR